MTEDQLSNLIEGVDATLTSVRKMNALFEPELAFRFNSLNFIYG